MRYLPGITQILNEGIFFGDNRAHGRVTVEPYWYLKTTAPGVGTNGSRGPYRYWQKTDNSQFEVEVPNIKGIEIDRSIDQEIASASITMYNHWHDLNDVPGELEGQLGQPGRFWYDRGSNATANATWNQSEALGATQVDGTDLPDFSWKNVLVPHALLRTYQGYGGFTDGVPMDIRSAQASGNLALTGVWLIDSVRAGTDGMLVISCRDIGRILRDQQVYPPTVPSNLYPIEYYMPGTSTFDSIWGPQPRQANANVGQQGRLKLSFSTGSGTLTGYEGGKSIDGNFDTYSLTAGATTPDAETHYWEYDVIGNSFLNGFTLYPYGGGYTLYVSVYADGAWVGADIIPGTSSTYTRRYPVPMAQVGEEQIMPFDLPTSAGPNLGGYSATKIRLTFQHNCRTSGPDGVGYRAGIRDITPTSVSTPVDVESIVNAPLVWSYAMARHPTRGYWVSDASGNTYGFGDATGFDTESGFYSPVSAAGDIIAMTSHPNGRGYWLLERNGTVHAHGCDHYGDIRPEGVPDNPDYNVLQAYDITSTYDGNGYWVIYSNGVVQAFGNAVDTPGMTSGQWTFDITPTVTYMEAVSADWPVTFEQKRGTGIVGHPSRLGFWACNGNGEVRAVGDNIGFYGEFDQRYCNRGQANQWRMTYSGEYIHGIECTADGNGYWLAGGSGRIGQFGSAIGKGTVDIYQHYRDLLVDGPPDDPFYKDWTNDMLIALFQTLVQDIVRDPSGKGFYLVSGNGTVAADQADMWGFPGYWGGSGVYWHAGNYPTPPGNDADYVDIVREFLMWGGFYLYDPDFSGSEGTDPEAFPSVYGALESTGINSTTRITLDKFDKKSLLDGINVLKEIVAYNFFIDDEGAARFESPNYWKSGNFVMNGKPADTDWDGTATSAAAILAGGYTDYIPQIHEAVNMTGYSAMSDGQALLTELIIGSQEPRYNDMNVTNNTRYSPPSATAPLYVGHDTPFARGINKPYMFMNSTVTNAEEQRLMAELINLQLWFQQRAGSVSCIGDPTIQVNDQVQIVERNTSDIYTHFVRGLKSSMDCDSGQWTMQLTTNWLGTPGDWVITKDNVYDPFTHVQVSERVSSWATKFERGILDPLDPPAEPPSSRLAWRLSSSTASTTLAAATVSPWTLRGSIEAPAPEVTSVRIESEVLPTWLGHPQIRFGGVSSDGTISAVGTYTDVAYPTGYGNLQAAHVQIDPFMDVSDDGYFYAMQFSWASGGTGYVGFQTKGAGLPGKAVVFSVAGAAVAATGATIIDEDFDGGTGISTRSSYEWTAGLGGYFTIRRDHEDGSGVWWSASVEGTEISQICVPVEWGDLNLEMTCFTERYSGPTSQCSDIEEVYTVFQQFQASLDPDDIDFFYLDSHSSYLGTPPNGCASSLVEEFNFPPEVGDLSSFYVYHHMGLPEEGGGGGTSWGEWIDLAPEGSYVSLGNLSSYYANFEISGTPSDYGTGQVKLTLSGTDVESKQISGRVVVTAG